MRHIEQYADDLLRAASSLNASYATMIVEKAEKLQEAVEALQDEADQSSN